MIYTKYKEINELLQKLTVQIQILLGDKLIGAYIGGSIAAENFDYGTSDIDYYIITTDLLSEDNIHKLAEMHKQLYSSSLPHAKKIEASYTPQKDLSNFDPSRTRPYFNEGNFYFAQYGNNYLIELHVLREKGISLVGQDIRNLIVEVSSQDIILAIQKNLREYWESTLNDNSKYNRSDYQVFAILTMCRMLYSLETGSITSKAEAAQWATQKLDTHWQSLIRKALAYKPDQGINLSEEAQEFVKYVLRNELT